MIDTDKTRQFERDGKEYKEIFQLCKDSLFSPVYIDSSMEKGYKSRIFLRDNDAKSNLLMAKFLDALAKAVIELRSEVLAKAKRIVPNCLCDVK